jgi:hypothetical protein
MNAKRDYGQFYAIINKMGITKQEIVKEFTNGRTDSLTALSDSEWREVSDWLRIHNKIPPGDLARKKMISIAKSMNWGENAKEIVPRLDAWLLKQKFAKPLMQLDVPQLSLMLTIFEQRVYADYLKDLNK